MRPRARSKTITLTLGEGQVIPIGLARLALKFLEGTDLYHELEAITARLTLGATPRSRKQLEEVDRKLAIVP